MKFGSPLRSEPRAMGTLNKEFCFRLRGSYRSLPGGGGMRRGWKGEGHLFKEDPVFGDILMTPKQRCCASGGKPHFTGVPLPSAARFLG